MNSEEFVDLRYGMFIPFGLYSLLGRGEWVMNREEMPRDEYRCLAGQFRPDQFTFDYQERG